MCYDVELNQHLNSKLEFYNWNASHYTQITQLKFEYVWIRHDGLDRLDMCQGGLKRIFDN
jgi:hypothetical protein